MTKNRPIVTLPNAKLRQKSKSITSITATVKKLAADMQASMLDWEIDREHEVGVALAAIQVGELERLIIVREDFENRENPTFLTYINPSITKKSGEPSEDYEGCLSVQDVYGLVPRYPIVEFKAKTLDGKTIKATAEGFLARVLQHEIDHTNGILFVDHIKDSDAFFELLEDGNLGKIDHEQILKSRILW